MRPAMPKKQEHFEKYNWEPAGTESIPNSKDTKMIDHQGFASRQSQPTGAPSLRAQHPKILPANITEIYSM